VTRRWPECSRTGSGAGPGQCRFAATLVLLGGVLLVVCIPLHDWFHRQPRLARVAILIGLLLAPAALVWLTRSYGS
jgi:hypothetical protein